MNMLLRGSTTVHRERDRGVVGNGEEKHTKGNSVI
jgi:hypothetical protein